MLRDGRADNRKDARDQRVFRLVAIGKAGIVGDVNVTRAGQRRFDLAKHRETANAGIEDKDRRGLRHMRASNWPSSNSPCGQKPSLVAELIWPSSGISQ